MFLVYEIADDGVEYYSYNPLFIVSDAALAMRYVEELTAEKSLVCALASFHDVRAEKRQEYNDQLLSICKLTPLNDRRSYDDGSWIYTLRGETWRTDHSYGYVEVPFKDACSLPVVV